MNTAGLKAAVEKNKVAIGAGGVGLVALVALRQRSRAAGGGAATTQVAGTGTYDSTASDVYNSIQPEIEALRDQIDLLARLDPAAQPTPAPTPANPSPVTSQVSSYVFSFTDPTPVAGYDPAPRGMQSSPITVQDKLIGVSFSPLPAMGLWGGDPSIVNLVHVGEAGYDALGQPLRR